MAPPAIVRVTLTPDEVAIITRDIVGRGGHQILLSRIVQRLNRKDRTLDLFPQDIATAKDYATKYGNGGYQDRFRVLIDAHARALVECRSQ